MNNDLKEKYLKIILFLQQKRVSNRKDIAKHMGEEWHSGRLKAMLNYLAEDGIIKNTKSEVYEITPKGDKFKSFDKMEENEDWQIRLAKSNIEANKFQKQMALKNHRWMIVNIIATSLLVIATVTQLILSIR